MVEQQVAGGKNTGETDKQIKILIRSANFLWEIDEEKSRDYLAQAFKIAEDRFNELGLEHKKIGTYKGENLTVAVPDYRFEVIREIAKKDRVWADRLIKKVLKDSEKDAENRKNSTNDTAEIANIMGVARESIKSDPNLSLNLYRMAMKYPLERHWFWQLYSMWRLDANLTDRVYSEALNAYAGETPGKLLYLSAFPFGSNKFFGADRFTFPIGVPQNYVPQPDLQMQFLNVFFARTEKLLNNPNELNAVPEKDKLAEIAYVVSALNELESYVLRDLPNMAVRFRSVKARANALMSEEAKKSLEEKENEYKNSTISFDEKLKTIEEADEKGALRDQDIIDLVLSAEKEEDYKQAESWIDKIKNDNARNETFSYFFYKRAELAVKEKRLADAEKFAKKVSVIDQQAIIGFKIGEAKIKDGSEKSEVQSILLEISKLTEKLENSTQKAQITLALAFEFEDVNHLYALDELGKAVKIINKLENPDLSADFINRKVSGNGYEFLYLITTPGNFEQTYEKISKQDFQLSLAYAQNLTDEYLKTIAVLKVAKNCLTENKKIAK